LLSVNNPRICAGIEKPFSSRKKRAIQLWLKVLFRRSCREAGSDATSHAIMRRLALQTATKVMYASAATTHQHQKQMLEKSNKRYQCFIVEKVTYFDTGPKKRKWNSW
jgi:hypothetical protein